ncbi:MAG: DUF937 domain-containing protein [Geminicoccaceae bacterium]
MSVNLVKLIMDQLTPDMIGKIAGGFGVNKDSAQGGLAALIPGLLAGLTGEAAKPGGGDRLIEAVNRQQQQAPDLLSNLGSILGGSGQGQLVEQGSGLISSLLGGGTATALIAAVAKFAGLGDGTAKSLLGLAGPLIMSVIGKQVSAGGLNAGGLTQLLAGQKDNIAAAMPKGFGDLLQGTGLLDSLGPPKAAVASAPHQFAAKAQTAAPRAPMPPPPPPPQPNRVSGMGKWIYIAVAVVAALLGWNYLGGSRQEPAVQTAPAPAATTAAPAAANLTVGGVDLGSQLKSLVESVTGSLGSVTDAASAQAALPKLNDAATQVDQMSTAAAQLPAAGKSALAGLVAAAMPAIQGAIDKAIGIPGVSDLLKPVLDGIVAKLDALMKV